MGDDPDPIQPRTEVTGSEPPPEPSGRGDPLIGQTVDRYKILGIWNESPLLVREGYDWLRDAFLSGGLIQTGCPYEKAVEMRFAEASAEDNPPSM